MGAEFLGTQYFRQAHTMLATKALKPQGDMTRGPYENINWRKLKNIDENVNIFIKELMSIL